MGKVIPIQRAKARQALERERIRLENRWLELNAARERIAEEMERVQRDLAEVNRVLLVKSDAARDDA